MPCIKIPNGWMCGSKQNAPKCVICKKRTSTKLCDWRTETGTCDKPLCDGCAVIQSNSVTRIDSKSHYIKLAKDRNLPIGDTGEKPHYVDSVDYCPEHVK